MRCRSSPRCPPCSPSCRRCSTSACPIFDWDRARRLCRAGKASGPSFRRNSRSGPPAPPPYILAEPTTGLHFADIAQLLAVLHRLRDEGNTIIVIEHNLDVIKTADWVVDLGPEGGDGGGRIIAVGTPEHIAANKASYTGHYLQAPLGQRQAQPARRKRA